MKICLATFVLMASMNYLVQTAPQSKIPSLTDLRMKAASIGYQWAPQFGQKVWREVKTGKLFLEQNNAVRPITLSELKAQKSRSNSASSKAVTAKKDGRRLVTAESSFLMPPDNLPGVEGIMTVPNGAAIRAAINRGARSGFNKCKPVFESKGVVITDSVIFYGCALVQGAASLETGFGKDWPTEKNQRESYVPPKWDTPMQEIGITRMNRHMLDKLGYSRDLQNKMNAQNDEGNFLNAEAFICGLAEYTLEGMSHYHRGGETRYNYYTNGMLNDARKKDTSALMDKYYALQKRIVDEGLTEADSAKIPWTNGPPKLSGSG